MIDPFARRVSSAFANDSIKSLTDEDSIEEIESEIGANTDSIVLPKHGVHFTPSGITIFEQSQQVRHLLTSDEQRQSMFHALLP